MVELVELIFPPLLSMVFSSLLAIYTNIKNHKKQDQLIEKLGSYYRNQIFSSLLFSLVCCSYNLMQIILHPF